MKKIYSSLAISLFLNFSLLSNSELKSAIDNLDVDKVEKIIGDNPALLNTPKTNRLIDRLKQKKRKHRILFHGASLAASALLGTLIGIVVYKAKFAARTPYDQGPQSSWIYEEDYDYVQRDFAKFLGIVSGMGATIIGTAVSAFFFPSDKYKKINDLL